MGKFFPPSKTYLTNDQSLIENSSIEIEGKDNIGTADIKDLHENSSIEIEGKDSTWTLSATFMTRSEAGFPERLRMSGCT